MRIGLRLRILFLLGGSMMLAFAPLFLAVATYTRFALQQAREASARTLGQALAAPVIEAARTRHGADLARWLDTQVHVGGGIAAIGVYSSERQVLGRAGQVELLDELASDVYQAGTDLISASVGAAGAWAVVVPAEGVRVALVLRMDDPVRHAAPLVRLMGLYTGVMALALLVLTYFAMTRLIVRPLSALTQVASRVATGARHFELPDAGTPELLELASSFRTMTERLLAEEGALRRKVDEVEKKTRELKVAQTELVRSERLASAGKLAVGLTHEIGNPIAALIGFLDLLLQGGLSKAEERDFLERMRRETDRIHRILQDLLQFARPASLNQKSDTEPGDVEAAVYDTIALVNPQQALTDVELGVDIFPDLPRVTLNRAQLTQVLLNLILNAASATGPSGQVKVSAHVIAGAVRITVEDNGPGVPQALADQIFEPFMTTKPPGEGTGLGLAVCRGLVEAAGGHIALDSSFSKGARFLVDLPILPAASAEQVREGKEL